METVVNAALAVPNVTLVVPVNPVPVMVTVVLPAGFPLPGDMPVITGTALAALA